MIVSDLTLLRALPGRLAALSLMRAEVGVLEDTAVRTRPKTAAEMSKSEGTGSTTIADKTNAEIGHYHEYGRESSTPRIPRRSFLKMPLETHGEDIVSPEVIAAVENALVGEATVQELGKALGEAAEAVIDKAFETGGFGTWEPLKLRTIQAKGNSDILRETSQLRNSITHRVATPNR